MTSVARECKVPTMGKLGTSDAIHISGASLPPHYGFWRSKRFFAASCHGQPTAIHADATTVSLLSISASTRTIDGDTHRCQGFSGGRLWIESASGLVPRTGPQARPSSSFDPPTGKEHPYAHHRPYVMGPRCVLSRSSLFRLSDV